MTSHWMARVGGAGLAVALLWVMAGGASVAAPAEGLPPNDAMPSTPTVWYAPKPVGAAAGPVPAARVRIESRAWS